METVNRDGTITICGVKLDFNSEETPKKWDYSEVTEGRTTTRNYWLDSYQTLGTATCCWSYKVSMTNRGKCFLDDKHLTDKDDIEKVKYIFSNLKKGV